MKYNADIHHRRSIRLKNYDYARAGAYFVTICAQGREDLFGEIKNGEMKLNEYDEVVKSEWLKTPEIRPNVTLDEWVIMPNHLHGIITIDDGRGTLPRARAEGKGREIRARRSVPLRWNDSANRCPIPSRPLFGCSNRPPQKR